MTLQIEQHYPRPTVMLPADLDPCVETAMTEGSSRSEGEAASAQSSPDAGPPGQSNSDAGTPGSSGGDDIDPCKDSTTPHPECAEGEDRVPSQASPHK